MAEVAANRDDSLDGKVSTVAAQQIDTANGANHLWSADIFVQPPVGSREIVGSVSTSRCPLTSATCT